MKITETDMASRIRRNKAASAITETMDKITKENGGLSVLEWAVVLNEALSRMLYYGLCDELKEDEQS